MPRYRWVVWALSWLAYASYYAGRKGLSVAKKSLHDQLGVSESALGAIDTSFLAAYSVGQFLSGFFGDHLGARRLVGFGMLASAVACAAFGASSSALVFGVCFAVNGLAQSTGWPGTTRAMAEWTTKANRGTVMAFWATCYQVGGIAATALAAFLLGRYGWRGAFYGPALWLVLVALAVLVWLAPGPASTGTATELATARRVAQRAVLKNPVLWCYGASYCAIKFIRYALLFWLPYFLASRRGYGEERAGYVSIAFEVGGVVGVIALGIASDRLRHYSRSLLSAVGLVGLTLALLLYSRLGASSTLVTVLGLALVGATLFGPDALLSGAASQDAGGPHAAATATGFVNGMGSIGSVLEGIVVPLISKRYGWDAVFQLFIGVALLGALALVPTLKRAAVSS
ncbi:MAG: MFS transporter [Myxococcales bacterium]|nr:MFS transporter [Myxococcales bacterium]